MIFKRIATGCLAATLVAAPVSRVQAGGDDIVGGIVGGIIGGVIVNEANRKRSKTVVRRSTKSQISSAQREANREVQVSLNYFGYPVGTPDGAIGPRSRAAISQYQATLGYPATGQLTEFERTILTGAYYRALSGGTTTAQAIATNPMGVRGLLILQRDEMTGVTNPYAPTAPAAVGTVLAAEPAAPAAPAEPAKPGLPTFLGGDTMQASLASHCNKVSLLTNTNGGFTTVASMADPVFALGEQFCLARTYAIAKGEELAGQVAGFTPQQIAQQCEGFGPAMQDHIAALSLKSRDDVLQGVGSFVLQTGMSPVQLAATSRICLSVGYRTDAMDVAIGSALLLTTLGESAYAELLGHHLAQGFGVSNRPDLALDWYQMGLDAVTQTGTAVFAPGQPERTDLIRKAAYTLGGRADLLAPDPVPASAPAALPSFALTVEPAAQPETEVAAAPVVAEPVADTVADTGKPMRVSPLGAIVSATMAPFSLLKN